MPVALVAGVSSYNVVDTALPDVKPIVRTAVVLFRRYRQIAEELAAAQASLAESTVIGKAQGSAHRLSPLEKAGGI